MNNRPASLACLAFAVAAAVTAAIAAAETISVTPTDPIATKIANASAGDTVSFAPGTYIVSKLDLKPGVIYDGGAGKAILSGPASDVAIEVASGTGTEITGFTFARGMLHLSSCAVNVHDNLFTGIAATNAIRVDAMHDSHIDHNTFQHIQPGSEAIVAYPGDNNTFDANRFDDCYEPIHGLGQNSHNQSFSDNVITHTMRHGIELQGSIWSSKVLRNYMSDWLSHIEDGNDSHMAVSAPTGEGGDNEIAQNVLIQNGPTQAQTLWAKADIELKNVAGHPFKIHDNYSWNWGGVTLDAPWSATFTNNIRVGAGTAPGAVGDQVALNDPKAPAAPAMPATAGVRWPGSAATAPAPAAAATAASSPAAAPVAPAAGALSLAGASTAHTITVSWAAQPAAGLLEIRPTHGDATMGWEVAASPAASAATATVSTYHGQALNSVAPQTWQYDLRLTIGTLTQTVTIACQAADSAPTAAAPPAAAPVPAPAPATQPAAIDIDISQLVVDEAKIAADLAKLQLDRQGGK